MLPVSDTFCREQCLKVVTPAKRLPKPQIISYGSGMHQLACIHFMLSSYMDLQSCDNGPDTSDLVLHAGWLLCTFAHGYPLPGNCIWIRHNGYVRSCKELISMSPSWGSCNDMAVLSDAIASQTGLAVVLPPARGWWCNHARLQPTAHQARLG